MNISMYQRTLAKPVSFQGVGVHSGKQVHLTVLPAKENHGIKFVRTDLPDQPEVTAHFNRVVDTSLATVIGYNGFIVSTIEHLMASFAGLEIDNAVVELDAYEVPILDGSAGPFTTMIRSAGIRQLNAPRFGFIIKEPIILEEENKSVAVFPSATCKITCTIAYDHPLVGQQSHSIELSDAVFEREISWARTFGFFHEVEYLKRYGFAKGGSLENAVVIGKDRILNEDGLRYQNEFVRHKILDSIGDFSLLGMPILGHIVLNRSGHTFNHAFLKKFFAEKGSWETTTVPQHDEIPYAELKSLAN